MNKQPIACLLSKNMRPSQKNFELLGFKFLDCGYKQLFHATLPIGWTMVRSDGYWSFIDENSHERGRYLFVGEMFLMRRYNIFYDPDTFMVFVKDLQNNEIPYEAGRCLASDTDMFETLVEDAENFLEANYPDWNDPTKYWG